MIKKTVRTRLKRRLAKMPGDRLRRLATYASVSTAVVLILIKLGAFLETESVAILSSLVDSSMDLMASLVAMFGVRQALKPADRSHRYGHGKFEALAALAQAAFITGSATLVFYEAMNRFTHPQPVTKAGIGLAVMLVSIALTVALVSFQKYVVRRTRSVAVTADSLHYTGDILGNLAVIAGLGLAALTGSAIWDTLFGVGVAAWLIWGAQRMARDSLDLLLDRELSREERQKIRRIAFAVPEVHGLHDLRTRSSGTHKFVEMHLELDGRLSLTHAHTIADTVEKHLKAAFEGIEVTIHEEPAGLMDERLDERLK